MQKKRWGVSPGKLRKKEKVRHFLPYLAPDCGGGCGGGWKKKGKPKGGKNAVQRKEGKVKIFGGVLQRMLPSPQSLGDLSRRREETSKVMLKKVGFYLAYRSAPLQKGDEKTSRHEGGKVIEQVQSARERGSLRYGRVSIIEHTEKNKEKKRGVRRIFKGVVGRGLIKKKKNWTGCLKKVSRGS